VSVVPSLVTPSDGSAVDGIAAGVDLTFNTSIQFASFIAPKDPPDGTESYDFAPHVLHNTITDETANGAPEYFLGGDFGSGGTYTWTMKQGAKIKDQCGVTTTFPAPDVALGTQVGFTTNSFQLSGIAPFDGQMSAPPYKHVQLSFNNYPDITTITAGAFTLNEGSATGPALPVVATDIGGGVIDLVGAFKASKTYVFKLNAGFMFKDCPGDQQGSCVTTGMTPPTTAMPVTFTTDVISATTSPADNDSISIPIDMATGKGPIAIDITFNQDMDATKVMGTLAMIPGVTLSTPTNVAANIVELTGSVAPGTYKITFGGTIPDTAGDPPFDVSTKGTVTFTVTAASAAPTPTPCF